MDMHLWLTFVAASIALLLIPGPTVLLVLSYAISQGRRVALASAAGVALGDFLAMTASLAGLGTIVLTSAKIFTALKWIGAIYLIYLGIKLFKSASMHRFDYKAESVNLSAAKVFKHAATVTALNPKSIVFFIAFVPQFIDPAASLAPQFGILIGTFVGLAMINVLVYALLADYLRQQLVNTSALPWLSRIGGCTLVLMGLFTTTLRRAST